VVAPVTCSVVNPCEVRGEGLVLLGRMRIIVILRLRLRLKLRMGRQVGRRAGSRTWVLVMVVTAPI